MVSPKLGDSSSPVDPQKLFSEDSPVLKAWKACFRDKLKARSHVFLMHEWDVGEAKGMETKSASVIHGLSEKGHGAIP